MNIGYIENAKKQFGYYKMLGEKTIAQVVDDGLFWKYNEESNSIATVVKHLWGNMLSRWTNFLTTDGEKQWRNRDAEFENDFTSRKELVDKWNEGWNCLFNALNTLTDDDLQKIIFIRNESHTVVEAVNRQLAHYSYHVGQIVFIGKMVCNTEWNSLSIPKGHSKSFNDDKFAKSLDTSHTSDANVTQKK